ncbi:MAG: class I SAM-dependent DNA methyltransferase, partial [Opitutae bacterium]|nr:class I SAM-dependent DNA methyltransferase [Opitutae bacterium]
SYLLHIGELDWQKINPDIFGSMIQAVADDEERGELGMHYTSVPNILKVLNPLFLDELREQLEEADDNARKLLNLRNRLAKIRVFDPACGSGNFLVIAYKEMREIEAEINRRRNEQENRTVIPITNFRGIEIRDFSAEIARLALIIAEYQCDVLHRGQKEAIQDFLPLRVENWITSGNALRIDWLSVCPPTGKDVQHRADDLFFEAKEEHQIDFENEGGETYICGNPPYLGSQWQSAEQKEDLQHVCEGRIRKWKSLDYVSGWFMKAADYGIHTNSGAALVSTNSICQGRQVEALWSVIFETGNEITFAHTSFKWTNLASHNAGVTVVIVGLSNAPNNIRKLFSINESGETTLKETGNINPYLISGPNVLVKPIQRPIADLDEMSFGNMPNEGGFLLLSQFEANEAIEIFNVNRNFIRPFIGSQEFIKGQQRYCIWIPHQDYSNAKKNKWLGHRFDAVREQRSNSKRPTTKQLSETPHRFGEVRQKGSERAIIVPSVSSESRKYLPVGYEPSGTILSNLAYGLLDAPLWNMALIASRIHLVWIATVCGKLESRFRYSNTLGWNTFPVPDLTEKNKEDLTRCAEDILLAREAHFPATIADLYNPDNMPDNLREAHERNDEVLERIYIGRRFKNDTERLEKLFELYVKMTEAPQKLEFNS